MPSDLYEVSAVVGHAFEGDSLVLKTLWAGYPKAGYTWQAAEDLATEAKEIVDEYFMRIDVTGIPKKEKLEKLKATAETIDHDEVDYGQSLKIKSIVGHRTAAGKMYLMTRWSNDEEVEVQKEKYQGDKHLLTEYLKENDLVAPKRLGRPLGSGSTSRKHDSDDDWSDSDKKRRKDASTRRSTRVADKSIIHRDTPAVVRKGRPVRASAVAPTPEDSDQDDILGDGGAKKRRKVTRGSATRAIVISSDSEDEDVNLPVKRRRRSSSPLFGGTGRRSSPNKRLVSDSPVRKATPPVRTIARTTRASGSAATPTLPQTVSAPSSPIIATPRSQPGRTKARPTTAQRTTPPPHRATVNDSPIAPRRTTGTNISIAGFWKNANGDHFCVVTEGAEYHMKKMEDIRQNHPEELSRAMEKELFSKL